MLLKASRTYWSHYQIEHDQIMTPKLEGPHRRRVDVVGRGPRGQKGTPESATRRVVISPRCTPNLTTAPNSDS
jgi:hypothetical protein